MCVLTLTTGTMFVMWLGEQITERGIGNGMSLLIFAGIVVNFPTALLGTLDQMQTGQIGPLRILFLIAMAVVVIGGHHLRRTWAPTDHGAIRQTCRWPTAAWRLEHPHPVESEHGRCHPGHFCVHPVVLHDGGAALSSRHLAAPSDRSGRVWDAALQPPVRTGSSSSHTSTRRSSSTPMTWRRTWNYGGFVPGIRPGKRTAEYIDTILRANHARRRALPGSCRAAARVAHHRVPGRTDPVHR